MRYKDTCPNYVEGEWETPDGHTYRTKDCAPKRSMILSQQIYDLMLDTRRDYGKVRTATVQIMRLAAMNTGVEFIEEGEIVEQKLIEDQTNGKDTG
jgi:hypothetical protein